MKKVMMAMMMVGALGFAACGGEAEGETDAGGKYAGDGTPEGDAKATCQCFTDIEAAQESDAKCVTIEENFRATHGEEGAYNDALVECRGW